MLLAAAAVGADSDPVQAQTADCLKEPTGQAPEGTRWVGRWEINYYRRCWVLEDAAGRAVPAQPANPPQSALRSFLGAGAQPQTAPARPAVASRPKSQPERPAVATASKPAHSETPKTGVHHPPVKPGESVPDRDALYAEFLKFPVKPGESVPDADTLYAQFQQYLRWRERQKSTGAK